MDSYEMKKQIAMCMIATSEQMRVTNPISDIDKKEIQELILSKYKRLSINEVYYAFKLERFGEYGEQISHFNRFDVIYVGQILERYRQWKQKTKIEHNISAVEKKQTATEKEKQYWINRGVTELLEHFEVHREIMEGKSYIYDIFDEMGLMPQDKEYKKRVHKDAIETLEYELNEKKNKSTNLKGKSAIAQELKEIQEKGNGKVKTKCKEIAMAEYLRKLSTEQFKKLKEKFKTH